MVELLGHDMGFTLWAKCDQCGTEIVAFGDTTENSEVMRIQWHPVLISMLNDEGWERALDRSWICPRCGNRPIPDVQNPWILRAPE